MGLKLIGATVLAGIVLNACGNRVTDQGPDLVGDPPQPVASHEAKDLDAMLRDVLDLASNDVSDPRLVAVSGPSASSACGVAIYRVSYETLDPMGSPATATEAVMLPHGKGEHCSGERPVLLYAHGTTTSKSYNTADTLHNPEALLVEGGFAAHGYIVVMPNYLGYDQSSMSYHPYLNAEVQARDMIDGLRAGLELTQGVQSTRPSGQLFVAGYSQGGHVAMATQRALERDYADEFTLTAALPMSGPYELDQFADAITSPDGHVNLDAELFMPYLLTSYQNAYCDVYTDPASVYQSPFDRSAPGIFPTDTPVATLVAEGLLPNDPTFSLLFGPGGLLTDSFRAAFPESKLRRHLSENALRGWTPRAPLALCGGMDDPTVYFSNATAIHDEFASRGVEVPVWDLEQRQTLPSGGSYAEVYDGFQLAKWAAGDKAQAEYHGELVPPFCYALARGFFAQAGGAAD